MLGKLRRTLGAARRVAAIYDRTSPAMEAVYRDLFLRDLRDCGIADIFYPVGAAANHGLLYLILRCLRECEVTSALEFGAGQTTLLLDRARTALGAVWQVRTIEHDQYWAEAISARCAHEVRHVDLRETRVGEVHPRFYDFDAIATQGERFDLIIIDGPPGSPGRDRFNRLGALAALDRYLADEFAVIIDDAEREGEAALVAGLRERLRQRGVAFREGRVIAAKTQHVFCSERFRAMAYF